MNKIIEYKVLVGAGYIDLQNKVNEHIKEGWQPIGGYYTSVRLSLSMKVII